MTTHPVTLALVGWPVESPDNAVARNYATTVAARISEALSGTSHRFACHPDQPVGFLPRDWRPHSVPQQSPEWPLLLVLKWNPDYTGHGTAAVHEGSGCSIIECNSCDLAKMDAQTKKIHLDTHIHEVGHLFGCAIGEMYDGGRYAIVIGNERVIVDQTGLEPRLDLKIHDPANELWSHPSRRDWLNDPMVDPQRGKLFCELNRAIIDAGHTLTNPPTTDTEIELIVRGAGPYSYTVYRQEPFERVWDPDANEFLEWPSTQQAIHTGSGGDGEPAPVPLLKPGEHPDTLSSYDLYMVKLWGPGWTHGFWFSRWDWNGINEGTIDLRIDRQQRPPSPIINQPIIAGIRPVVLEHKPIIETHIVGLVPGVRYNIQGATQLQSVDPDLAWAGVHSFTATGLSAKRAFPNRAPSGQVRFLRVARAGGLDIAAAVESVMQAAPAKHVHGPGTVDCALCAGEEG